jgi:hypothetical protein
MLIAKHPDVSALSKEGPNATPLLPNDDRCKLPRRLFALYPSTYRLTEADLLRFNFDGILRDWAEYWDTSKRVLFEKCPANATRMRLLQAAFPDARFMGIVRNPYVVCEGIRRRRGHPLEDCARHWREANRIMLEDAGHVNHFLLISYEYLTKSLNEAMEEVWSFLEIPPITLKENEVFDRHNITNTPQPVRNMNPHSIGALSESERQVIRGICWPFADQFGYAASASDLEA